MLGWSQECSEKMNMIYYSRNATRVVGPSRVGERVLAMNESKRICHEVSTKEGVSNILTDHIALTLRYLGRLYYRP